MGCGGSSGGYLFGVGERGGSGPWANMGRENGIAKNK